MGLFGSKKQKLQKKSEKLYKEAFELSKTDRAASDRKIAEAEEIQRQLIPINSWHKS